MRPDDPRLPAATVTESTPLRMNTEPLPPEAMGPGTADHAARLTAMKRHLRELCGEYAAWRPAFVERYLDALAAHIEEHRQTLSDGLRRYDGFFAPEDWLWSALRPLPRAWVEINGALTNIDVAFWDGAQVIAVMPEDAKVPEPPGLLRISPKITAFDGHRFLAALPGIFHQFWRDETLPRSPFRRAIPAGVLEPQS
jgi:hypothetical protein